MTDFELRTVPATVHGRFLVRPGSAERLLVGFHGYAETGEAHMDQLQKIPGADEWTLVAVQALHPFYIARTGAIGASWMTSLDRDLAIEDNRAYVRSVVSQFPRTQQLVFLGFSQGASMAYRAAAGSTASGVIVFGGELPPELMTGRESLPPVLIGRGTTEGLYSEEKFKENVRFLAASGLVTTCTYEGGHEWTDEFREAAGNFLATLRVRLTGQPIDQSDG